MRRLNITNIMNENIDPIIEFLLNSETESVINSLAQNIIAEGIPENSNFQIMGIDVDIKKAPYHYSAFLVDSAN